MRSTTTAGPSGGWTLPPVECSGHSGHASGTIAAWFQRLGAGAMAPFGAVEPDLGPLVRRRSAHPPHDSSQRRRVYLFANCPHGTGGLTRSMALRASSIVIKTACLHDGGPLRKNLLPYRQCRGCEALILQRRRDRSGRDAGYGLNSQPAILQAEMPTSRGRLGFKHACSHGLRDSRFAHWRKEPPTAGQAGAGPFNQTRQLHYGPQIGPGGLSAHLFFFKLLHFGGGGVSPAIHFALSTQFSLTRTLAGAGGASTAVGR